MDEIPYIPHWLAGRRTEKPISREEYLKQQFKERAIMLGLGTPQILQAIDDGILWHEDQLHILSQGQSPSLDELERIIELGE